MSQETQNIQEAMEKISEQTLAASDSSIHKDENQYLTFILGKETYGLDILKVQEIRGWTQVTQIPNAPNYIRGVINLRGEIVPILDLRRRFEMDELEFTATTVVIVVNVQDRTIGMVVDGVSDVINMPEGELKASPDFGTAIDASFVQGLAALEQKMVIILAIDKMLQSCELVKIDSLVDSATASTDAK